MARARGTTIAALASPAGGARRAVLRISGPDAARVIAATCRVAGEPLALAARGAVAADFAGAFGPLPVCVLWFPGPASFTGEDVAELHLPGALPLQRRALERVLAAGAALAEPGEFTRRAFQHGRLDLSRVEGVLALVEARTRGERRAATALLFGGLERRLAGVRDALDNARALVEASLDFDEGDTGHVPLDEVRAELGAAHAALAEAHLFEGRRERQRAEARVVLVGEPNAGKSRLFNALRERFGVAHGAAGPEDLALVADVRGTTRDTKVALLALGERRVALVDTAGLELSAVSASAAAPEAHAEERTLAARAAADVLLWVVDARHPELASERHAARALGDAEAPALLVWSQVDRAPATPLTESPCVASPGAGPPQRAAVATSAVTGAGLDSLAAALARALGDSSAAAPRALDLAARTAERLSAAAAELDGARTALDAGAPLDLVAQHLRDATGALDALSGRTTPEDLLDRIFARFCLGK